MAGINESGWEFVIVEGRISQIGMDMKLGTAGILEGCKSVSRCASRSYVFGAQEVSRGVSCI